MNFWINRKKKGYKIVRLKEIMALKHTFKQNNYGFVQRIPKGRLAKQMVTWVPQGRYRRGQDEVGERASTNYKTEKSSKKSIERQGG